MTPCPSDRDVLLCRGCCCGTAREAPQDRPRRPSGTPCLDCDGAAGVRVRVVDCLDQCDRSNVVLVRDFTGGRRPHDTWLGGVLNPRTTEHLVTWVQDGGALPRELVPHRFGTNTRGPHVTALLVAGTTSDAGKSIVTTGLCRALARRGVLVAPFKAQNMSNNSWSTRDGAEIGRAQWIQALAARAEPEAAMNPVLLKPGSDQRSHVVVMGRPCGEVVVARLRRRAGRTSRAAAYDAVRRPGVPLRRGGRRGRGQPGRDQPARRRLREHGPGAARAACRRSWSATSTAAACSPRCTAPSRCWSRPTRRLVAGFVVNKFRGDASLLTPGLDELERADRPPGATACCRGTPTLWLDSEDALDLEGRRVRTDRGARGRRGAAAADQQLHRRRRARPRARPRRVFASRPARPRRRRPGRAARHPRHHRRPRLAAPRGLDRAVLGARRAPVGRCSASAAGSRCSGRTDRRPRRRRGRRRRRSSTGSACSTSTPTFAATRCCGCRWAPPGAAAARLRDPPRPGHPWSRPRSSWAAPARRRVRRRCGTAASRATASGRRS